MNAKMRLVVATGNAGKVRELGELLADGDLYASDPSRAVQAQARHAQIDEELTLALQRWEALEVKT